MTDARRSPPSIRIGACIDDVGLHPGVTEAALALCEAGRASAAALGAGPLRSLARKAGLAQNSHLLGIYGFNGSAGDHLARLGRWCARAAEGTC